MVRDWMTGSFEELAESVAYWFDNFAIAPLGDTKTPTPLLRRVIESALSPAETGDKGVGSIKIPLWKAALDSSRPIPQAAVTRILNLHRSYIVTGELDNRKSRTPDSTLYLRMGLLKAFLIRKGKPMKPELNPDYESSAYHCGRLVAMLAALQRAALPDVDAGVAQRYYGAASVTPRLVVGRLTRLAQHHVAKIASDRKGLSYWYETRIGEIVTAIKDSEVKSGKPLPATFNPQEQTEFALGYYQQIAENRTKKADKPAGVADVDPEPETITA
jgi:CRISPR-associated protein Csd1